MRSVIVWAITLAVLAFFVGIPLTAAFLMTGYIINN